MREYKNINRFLVDRRVHAFAAGLSRGATVLDLGAGSGHYRRLFNEQRYMAIDRGYEQQSFRGLDVVADASALPCRDQTMDAIICVEVIEHLPDPRLLLNEAYRVLKEGGKMLVTSPLCFGEHMQPHDYLRYTRFALEQLYGSVGFAVVRIEPRGGYFVLLAYLLARTPDQLSAIYKGRLFSRVLKPVLRLALTYMLAPLVFKLDRFDRSKSFTLGYCCELTKAPGPVAGSGQV